MRVGQPTSTIQTCFGVSHCNKSADFNLAADELTRSRLSMP